MEYSHITRALLSEDVHTRLAGLAALDGCQDPSLSPAILDSLLRCLGHNHKQVQRGAAAHLVRLASQWPEVTPALLQRLSDPDPRVRWTAAFVLAQLELPDPTPLSVLIENLGHQESDLRWAAATAVLNLAVQHSQPIVDALLALVRTGNAVQRRMALYCLRDLKQTSPAAQVAYRASLGDPDPMVRLGGVSCLGKLKLSGTITQAALLSLLASDSDLGVRRSAAVSLGQIGDADQAVLHALQAAAAVGDKSLHKAARAALAKLSP